MVLSGYAQMLDGQITQRNFFPDGEMIMGIRACRIERWDGGTDEEETKNGNTSDQHYLHHDSRLNI